MGLVVRKDKRTPRPRRALPYRRPVAAIRAARPGIVFFLNSGTLSERADRTRMANACSEHQTTWSAITRAQSIAGVELVSTSRS